ncbi:MAG: type II toxin-antitoxin system VapC family toxin [Methylocystis sp.]|jgi:predicted nucleic acid-binding protein
MILADTSVLIASVRDRTGARAQELLEFAGDREIVVSRFTEMELLAGAKDERDWRRLSDYLAKIRLIDPTVGTWREAARIYFDLRRQGTTIRSLVDCCIAQIAMDESTTLVHDDRDFDAIARIRPLNHVHFG